jgi:cytosine/adenosine deaminase-related metal-dependent hydrolase
MFKLLKNCKILTESFEIKKAQLFLQDDTIYDVLEEDEKPRKPIDITIDLENQIVFPGLINGHDHLIDTSWTKLAERPFENWYEWLAEAKTNPVYKDLQRLSVTDLYTIGMYKNIISGTTTVVDHFPSEVSKTFTNHPLTTLLEHFFLAHSVSKHQLQWGRSIIEQFANTRGVLPFILHIGEGKSSEIKEELEVLNRIGALEDNTVLVNGTHLDETALKLIASKKASLVWLPTSSQNVFGAQPNLEAILEMEIPLTIGTDSSNTGSSNMINELNFALKYCEQNLNGKINAKKLLKMVTIDSAKIFKLDKEIGTITPGKTANLVIFKPQNNAQNIFEEFLKLQPEDISMVIHKGMLVVGDEKFRNASSIDFDTYSEVTLNGKPKILFGKPMQLLERIYHKLGSNKSFPFFPINVEL